MSYVIKIGKTDLTKELLSAEHAALAYNTLAYMGEEKRVDVEANGQMVSFDRNSLAVYDENAEKVELKIDPELFGSEEDNEAAKEAAFQKYKKEFLAEEGPEGWSEKMERKLQEPYSLCANASDNTRIWFAPEVWDFDKANDMYNLMHHGMADGLRMQVTRDPGYHDDGPEPIRFESVCLVNSDGDVLCENEMEDWAIRCPLTDADIADLDDGEALEV